jgi:uridine kinase
MKRSADPTEVLTDRILGLVRDRCGPVLVAIDGRSGAGKSTLATAVSGLTGAVVIDGDGFYAGGSAEEWDIMSAAEKVEHCIDWRRQRTVLDDVSDGRPASWFPYDWDADDGRVSTTALKCPAAGVVILDGAYSARPELADLFALRVLLDTSPLIRRQRLLRREGEQYRADWEARWSVAEEHYFRIVMPRYAYDLVIGS